MRALSPLLLLGLAACNHALGGQFDRGLTSPHQPIVGANGAYVPGCPDWSTAGGQAHEGQASNYGCATATNLAAMIADPADLLHGKSDTLGTGEMAAKAIKAWRETPPSSKQWVVTTSATKTGGAK